MVTLRRLHCSYALTLWSTSEVDAGKYLGEHPMSYSTKSVTLGVFLWLRQAGNNELLCNEVSTIRCASAKSAACLSQPVSSFLCRQ